MASKVRSKARKTVQVVDGEYHFLDVGDEKYGECILVVFGKLRILIDGSHRGDIRSRNGRPSIPDQLAEILGAAAPHKISLVVVTHGHADHIGCLPELLTEGVIRPEWALVTHPKLGFGRAAGDNTALTDAATNPHSRLAAALREEDASDMSDADLTAFLDTVATVEPRYAEFLENLRYAGVNVVEYGGGKLPAKLLRLLKPTGITLLGPSEAQLLLCAEQIEKTNTDAAGIADAFLRADNSLDDVALYRAATTRDGDRDEPLRNPRGSGMNCQSITLAFGPKSARVLLAGDMQFTAPSVRGLSEEIQDLRTKVIAEGPYVVFKTTHHTSDNGQDDGLLTDLGDPPIIVHSGGLNDEHHPDDEVLRMLRRRREDIQFVRTDRNGRIIVRPHLDLDKAVEASRGRANNFTANVKGDNETPPGTQVVQAREPEAMAQAAPAAGPQVIIVNLPAGPIEMSVGGVEIVIRSGEPGGGRPAAATQGGGPDKQRGRMSSTDSVTLAAGRQLPKLLFVTNKERLEASVGKVEACIGLDAVRAAGQTIVEVGDDVKDATGRVASLLARDSTLQGVVILGGYDVVPCHAVDVLGPDLRRSLDQDALRSDEDRFIVWSDEAFGDVDGDRIGERPVSRIADARDARLFHRALSSRGVDSVNPRRFGIRNLARPFAADIWASLPGDEPLNVSERFLYTDAEPEDLAKAQLHYLMLHSHWSNTRKFFGERADGAYTNAFLVNGMPKQFDGLAFSGCCWGALTVHQKAHEAGLDHLAPMVAENSIALTYLQAGGTAFVGCTGAHYSGEETDPDVNYASRMHAAFWKALPTRKYSAAEALHVARSEYSAYIVGRSDDMEPIDLARRLKNRGQFTCLGLGW